MKTIFIAEETREVITNKIQRTFSKVFGWLTGYEIIFEGSRKDLKRKKPLPHLIAKQLIQFNHH